MAGVSSTNTAPYHDAVPGVLLGARPSFAHALSSPLLTYEPVVLFDFNSSRLRAVPGVVLALRLRPDEHRRATAAVSPL